MKIEKICEQKKTIEKLKSELKDYKTIKKFNFQSERILLIQKHHDRDLIVTVETEYSNCHSKILLSGLNFYAYHVDHMGRLETRQTMKTGINRSKDYWFVNIFDFCGVINKGFGSIVMRCFLDYIKQFPVATVTGFLSSADIERSPEHEKLLYHFYEKFGFEITERKGLILRLISTAEDSET